MNSDMYYSSLSSPDGLLRVELDDELLVDITADLLTRRQSEHVTRQLLDIDLEPARDLKALGGNQGLLDGEEVTELLADSDDVAGLDAVDGMSTRLPFTVK